MTVIIGQNKYENSNFLTHKKGALVLIFYFISADPGFRNFLFGNVLFLKKVYLCQLVFYISSAYIKTLITQAAV